MITTITQTTTATQSPVRMPLCHLSTVASPRASMGASQGGVPAVAARRRLVGETVACAYVAMDDFVFQADAGVVQDGFIAATGDAKGAFPGPSAWSPPI